MTENDASSGFWRFSLALYACPGVKDASLTLQDTNGDDVVLLYACLYAGTHGSGALSRQTLRALITDVGGWQNDVTAPLRAARRGASGQAQGADLRPAILEIELAAERIAHMLAAPLLGAE